MSKQSTRAQIITRRTYNRPKQDGTYETWDETIDRVISHQRYLWETQLNNKLNPQQENELTLLRHIFFNRIGMCSGRTLWLGGTDISKKLHATQFNCSGLIINNVNSLVDAFFLLLQGVGVGFKVQTGSLFGFSKKINNIKYIPSIRTDKGYKKNLEEFRNNKKTWYLKIGDSSEAWAKSVGKLVVMKDIVDEIIIDFSEIRPAGSILSNFGWITSGFQPLQKCFQGIIKILNNKSGQVLNELDIMDIMNHIGTTLSSRRSAEICVMNYENPLSSEFAVCKKDHWIDNPQRSQSNNSIAFNHKPSKEEMKKLFDIMMQGGGSEPGFINEKAFKENAPYYQILNPCAEISLPDRGFCNLHEINLLALNDLTDEEAFDAVYIIARSNYRQTLVDFKKDPILTNQWDENNKFLRLTGVGLTGVVQWKHFENPEMVKRLKETVLKGVNDMADELGLNRSFLTTCIKPSGSLSKIMANEGSELCEGIHKPLGKYILNNIRVSVNDPLVEQLKKCNYKIFPDPYNQESILVALPVKYENIDFDVVEGVEVNLESAITQLNRYKYIMKHYVQHNCSITVSYDPTEVPDIIDWFDENWDIYKGVSFIYRNDPTKTAEDLGYPYLPQEVITKEKYEEYVETLLPFELDKKEKDFMFELVDESGCAGGVCPIR